MVIIMKKNRLIIVLVCCTLLYMTGCGHSKDVERNVLRVGVVLYTQDDPFINALTECLRDELKKYESDSFKIIMTVRYGKNDQNIQDEAVGEILDAGCDILAVDLVDRTEPSNIIKMAKTENVPVIFFNREPVWEDLMQWDKLYYVGGDARQSGIMQGEIVSEVIHADQGLDHNGDGKIQYVLLEGEAGHQDAIIRTDSVVREAFLRLTDGDSEEETVQKIHAEKFAIAPDCANCLNPCGNTSDYDMAQFYAADAKIIAAKRDLIEAICKKMSSSEIIPETVYQGIAYLGYDLEPEAYAQIQQKIMCYDLIQ